MGINKLVYALDSDYIPGFDECTMAPYDTMHVEFDGLVRMEMAYLLFILIKKRKFFTLAQVCVPLISPASPSRIPRIFLSSTSHLPCISLAHSLACS